ncbi:hypothetical protein, partial [Burkholderia glumae]|uniref:hypothetical protein n=1 Tax=Burkholderia glumae TaxID=337 RepID=UPI0019D71D38
GGRPRRREASAGAGQSGASRVSGSGAAPRAAQAFEAGLHRSMGLDLGISNRKMNYELRNRRIP